MATPKAAVFTVWDIESGNAVAHFDSWDEAVKSIEVAAARDPDQVELLAVVSYDKQGNALESWAATDLFTKAS